MPSVCHFTGEKLFQCEGWDYCLDFFSLKICKVKTFVHDLYNDVGLSPGEKLFHFQCEVWDYCLEKSILKICKIKIFVCELYNGVDLCHSTREKPFQCAVWFVTYIMVLTCAVSQEKSRFSAKCAGQPSPPRPTWPCTAAPTQERGLSSVTSAGPHSVSWAT